MTEAVRIEAEAIDASVLLIVIPCLNEERHLPRLLEQLIADVPGADIVVADGGSSDRSCDIVTTIAAKHPNLRLLHNADRIQSAGVNLAVRRFGQGKAWLLRIDAHCTYPDGYASGLLKSAAQHGADSVVVPMYTRGKGCFQRAAAAAQNSAIGTGGSPHRGIGRGRFVDHGHHALMRIAPFMAVGGYREALSHNEDAELDLRLVAAGARIWLEPASAIVYLPRSSPGALARQYFQYGRGRACTVRLHNSRLKPRQAIPLAVPVAVCLALFAPLWPPLALPALLWMLACLVAGAMIGLRAGDRCALASGFAAMLMHLSWGTGYIAERLRPRRMPRLVPALAFR